MTQEEESRIGWKTIRNAFVDFTYWSLSIVFLIDVMSIYKGNFKNRSRRYDIFRSPELRLSQGPFEKAFSSRWRLVYMSSMLYLTVKLVVLLDVQLSSYLVKIVTKETSKEFSRNHFSYKLARLFMSLEGLVGCPLNHLVGSCEIIYGALFIELMYYGVYFPNKTKRIPLDYIQARMAFDYHREIQRVQLVVEGIVKKINQTALLNNWNLLPYPTFVRVIPPASSSDTGSNGGKQSDRKHDKKLGYPHSMLRVGNQHHHSGTITIDMTRLRPCYYSEEFSNSLITMTMMSAFFIGLPSIIVSLAFIYGAFQKEISIRCAELNYDSSSCRQARIFTDAEVLSALELIFTSSYVSMLNTIHILTSYFCINGLHEMTEGIKRIIESCSQLMAEENEARSKNYMPHYRLVDSNQFNEDGCYPSKPRDKSIFSPNRKLFFTGKGSRDKVDSVLIESYIRISVIIMDIRSTVGCANEFCQALMAGTVGTLIITVIISASISSVEYRLLVNAGFILAWIAANTLLFYCAQAFARISKIEGQAASMLALFTERSLYDHRTPDQRMDSITSLWYKLLLSRSFDDKRNCIAAFGLPFSYRRLIELNFALVSIYSLSRQITG